MRAPGPRGANKDSFACLTLVASKRSRARRIKNPRRWPPQTDRPSGMTCKFSSRRGENLVLRPSCSCVEADITALVPRNTKVNADSSKYQCFASTPVYARLAPMKWLSAFRRALACLALLGLVLSPLAWPVATMDSGGTAQSAEIAAAPAADMAEMDCCPDAAPKQPCAKICPLLAMCMAKTFPSPVCATGPALLTVAHVVIPGDVARLHGLDRAPPPRPPNA